MFKTIISSEQLLKRLEDNNLVIVDCRYDLMEPDAGKQQYHEAHIKGAVFADVHDDLSGPPLTDNGRHPLPSSEALNQLFSSLGISNNSQVVVYDSVGGSFAARLWWLLRYMGHEDVALLDGGWPNWQKTGFPIASAAETRQQIDFMGTVHSEWLVTLDNVNGAKLLIDSRDPARYRGESEPIDKQAGHIPGALNHFWKNNLTEQGLFRSEQQLKADFRPLFGQHASTDAVFYCGSGVTACHNLLAVAHSGLEPPRLYAGSWSEWCSDPVRPVATGNN